MPFSSKACPRLTPSSGLLISPFSISHDTNSLGTKNTKKQIRWGPAFSKWESTRWIYITAFGTALPAVPFCMGFVPAPKQYRFILNWICKSVFLLCSFIKPLMLVTNTTLNTLVLWIKLWNKHFAPPNLKASVTLHRQCVRILTKATTLYFSRWFWGFTFLRSYQNWVHNWGNVTCGSLATASGKGRWWLSEWVSTQRFVCVRQPPTLPQNAGFGTTCLRR